MKSRSIRYYFFTSITAVLVASMLVMGLVQSWLSTTYFRQEKESLLSQVTHVVAEGVQTGRLDPAGTTLDTLADMARVAGAVVYIAAPNGVVVYSTGAGAPAPGAQVPADILDALAADGRYVELGTMGGLFDSNYYTSAEPLIGSEGRLQGNVFASSGAEGLQVYLLDTMSAFVFSAALVLLVAGVLALVLSSRTVTPLRRIADASQRFAEGDYSARVPVQGDGELAALSITFNEMANAIEATDQSRRSFMGNIAHELRTPMTTIKGFIDGMLDGTIPVDQRDKYLAVVSDEVGRLARLTRNMLDISRLEAGEYVPNNTVFDIWGPLASVVLSAEQRMDEKGLACEGMAHREPAWVLADEDFVHQILFNLVDNAVKFSQDGGVLTVTVGVAKGMVTVAVRNTGAGIPADALPHVFDRFFKADKSRGVNARGAGLGLHISKVLTGLMGGRIWAESVEGEWSEFLFTLPAAPTPKKPPRGKWTQEKGKDPPKEPAEKTPQ